MAYTWKCFDAREETKKFGWMLTEIEKNTRPSKSSPIVTGGHCLVWRWGQGLKTCFIDLDQKSTFLRIFYLGYYGVMKTLSFF